jgi:hypothetical protein
LKSGLGAKPKFQMADTVEKLRKRIAVKFRPNDILSENRCSMPPQCGYGGRLLLQRQLPRPPKSFFDSPAHGSTNYGSSPKTEFFDSIGQLPSSRTLGRTSAKGGKAEIQTETSPSLPLLRAKLFQPVKRLHRRAGRQFVRVDGVEGLSKNVALRCGRRARRREQRQIGHGAVRM